MNKKELIIISGCTGSIGEAFFIHYLLNEEDCLIYGISRKGIQLKYLKDLPQYNSIINFDITSKSRINNFVNKIPRGTYKTITYIHLLGEFKTEIDAKHLKYKIENDHDKDGIDDDVNKLVYTTFSLMVESLSHLCKKNKTRLNIIQTGSLTDKYELECFHSWWKAKKKTLAFITPLVENNKFLNHYLLNVSTILSTKEFIDRPHVFVTEANPKFWLPPEKLASEATKLVKSKRGLIEKDIFIANPSFSHNYFNEKETYERRVRELFNKSL
jgi:NADP-dependent 3-hydroxy acid dehydrogenase YdfG